MFLGINGSELVVLAILAVVILGPEKLPEYAAQLARLVKELRRMATGAKEQLRDEVGDEIVDMDWRKLDPRQYDPRKIIKEALLDDFQEAVDLAKEPSAVQQRSISPVPVNRLAADEPAPFDYEAT
ncbi:Sec-independent protein translocase TatB [Arthrobacter sp. MYb227]|uniref:sec-independent translocase n=1 Tax=Arthrobacter sp. MYb227 TaxID=1848601 RepID=UPI000CFB978C|nr:sec-independent translocase [Arthrobacter sp. MYb227]PQZ95960.1 Sec-independent protein translocase TatB [Arthrobacter sp. MYb227]